jgi:hypothetical protein
LPRSPAGHDHHLIVWPDPENQCSQHFVLLPRKPVSGGTEHRHVSQKRHFGLVGREWQFFFARTNRSLNFHCQCSGLNRPSTVSASE